MPNVHSELLDDQMQPLVHPFCCPIVIGSFSLGAFLEPPERVLIQQGEELPRLRSGTLTFVRHDGEIYGITCGHVLDALSKSIELSRRQLEASCGAGAPYPSEVWNRFFFLVGDRHVDINVQFEKAPDAGVDLAAGWIPPEIFAAIGRQAIDIGVEHELPDEWPEDAGAFATGYPEANRRIYGRVNNGDTLALAGVTLCSGVEKPTGRKIRMFAPLEPGQASGVDVLSGMSGGPIVVTCGDLWGLAGIVSGGYDLHSFAKSEQKGFFEGPAINIEGEALSLHELRLWLESLKGLRTDRSTKHVQVRQAGKRAVLT